MAAGTSDWSAISAFAGTIYEGAMIVARDNMVVSQLCRFLGDRTGMAPRSNSQYGTATMGTVSDLTDLTSENFDPTVLATLTPVEWGTQFLVTDQRRESDPFGIMQDAANELGMATAGCYEERLCTDFGSFTGGTIGSAASGGSTITLEDHYKAITYLRSKNAPGPYVAIYHPWTWFRMVGTVAPMGSISMYGLTDRLVQQFYMGNIGGAMVFTSNWVASGTAGTCGMFSRDALALDMRRAARLEPQRDASKRAWELNETTVFAHGVWRATFGVKFIGHTDAP